MSLLVSIKKNLGDFKLDIHFESENGLMGLLGPSGCGKSYTLKCIAGIETPDEGRIVLNGVTLYDSEARINLPPQKRHVGYLFQNYALFPNMTVKQNIYCGMRSEKDAAKKAAIYADMMRLLNLTGLDHHKPHQLSGGQAQRVALGRILVSNPSLILLDEPFSALDSHLRLSIQLELKELLTKLNKQIIMVSHSRDEAYHMCTDVAVVSNGQVIVHKSTKALFTDPEHVEAARITGCKNIIPAAKVDEHTVQVPAWGNAVFEVKQSVPDDLTAIGIRAHYFNATTPHNRIPVRFMREMEEPFETIMLFRYENQSEDTADIWWRQAKDKRPTNFPAELGIAPANILLLK